MHTGPDGQHPHTTTSSPHQVLAQLDLVQQFCAPQSCPTCLSLGHSPPVPPCLVFLTWRVPLVWAPCLEGSFLNVASFLHCFKCCSRVFFPTRSALLKKNPRPRPPALSALLPHQALLLNILYEHSGFVSGYCLFPWKADFQEEDLSIFFTVS